MSYGIRLKVWGDYACFTRPEMKVERVSYEVMTPSAARGILEAVHWKPAIRWVVDTIHVLNPIVFDSVRRNEVEGTLSPSEIRSAMTKQTPLHLFVDEQRQQRAALVLRNVAYVIEAHFDLTDKAGPDDSVGKHLDIFNRRARTGKCFHRPYLGCREFAAHFALVEGEMPESKLAHDATRHMGVMLYDLDFTANMQPLFFAPRLEEGRVDVARWWKEAQ